MNKYIPYANKGLTNNEIAKKFGVSRQAVAQSLYNAGYTRPIKLKHKRGTGMLRIDNDDLWKLKQLSNSFRKPMIDMISYMIDKLYKKIFGVKK